MFTGKILPKNISLDAEGGPEFDVDIVSSNSGVETRTVVSELPRFAYDISFVGKLKRERDRLISFFLVHFSAGKSFRYFDHFDHEIAVGEGAFVAIDGSPSDDWQLVKVYDFDGLTFYRKITKPIEGSLTWSGGGTMDWDTGIVTGGAPADPVGQFHMHARFNAKQLNMRLRDKNNTRGLIVDLPSIPIVEIKTAD